MTDEPFLRRALALAARGKHTHPNPKVGAVVVRDGRIVGEGWHVRPGTPHAEAMAFSAAGEAARGATVYVTLEPCAHTTQPDGAPRLSCTQRCLDAGISRIVCAMEDPDSRVSGAGLRRLRDGGVDVTVGVCETEARALNRPYIKHRTTGLPWVRHKTAMTLDGKIATVTGSSQWITGPESREYAHRALRGTADAIVVGSNTVIVDDPSLTNRSTGRGNDHQPLRVVMDSGLRIPVSAKVCGPGTIIFAVGTEETRNRIGVYADKEVEVVLLPADGNGHVDASEAMRYLANKRGALSILLEAGSELAAAFYKVRLVDEAIFFVAPKLVGGKDAPTPIGGEGLARTIDGAFGTGPIRTRRFGTDLALLTDILYGNDTEAEKA